MFLACATLALTRSAGRRRRAAWKIWRPRVRDAGRLAAPYSPQLMTAQHLAHERKVRVSSATAERKDLVPLDRVAGKRIPLAVQLAIGCFHNSLKLSTPVGLERLGLVLRQYAFSVFTRRLCRIAVVTVRGQLVRNPELGSVPHVPACVAMPQEMAARPNIAHDVDGELIVVHRYIIEK